MSSWAIKNRNPCSCNTPRRCLGEFGRLVGGRHQNPTRRERVQEQGLESIHGGISGRDREAWFHIARAKNAGIARRADRSHMWVRLAGQAHDVVAHRRGHLA